MDFPYKSIRLNAQQTTHSILAVAALMAMLCARLSLQKKEAATKCASNGAFV